MDLQGHLGRTYNVNFRLSDKPKRPSEKTGWPASSEENYERLKDAGEVVDVGMAKCGNCDKMGHIAKSCPEDKVEPSDRAVVKCYLCEETGHRMRDWCVLVSRLGLGELTFVAPKSALTGLPAVTATSLATSRRSAQSLVT